MVSSTEHSLDVRLDRNVQKWHSFTSLVAYTKMSINGT